MPKTPGYLLIWRTGRSIYELCAQPGQHPLAIHPGEQDWFAWLDSIPSFSFQGRSGRLVARKESRLRGEGYWYAYRRVGSKLSKKYLGRTADLTLTRLEEVATLLTASAAFSLKGSAAQSSPDERGQAVAPPEGGIDRDGLAAGLHPRGVASAGRSIQPDPLLTTRLYRPRPRGRLVPRSRLVERLQQRTECALTLVSAPAGFGKTTLLAQWLAESSSLAAWLSLVPEDNDPVRFFTSLIAALQTIDVQLGAAALEQLRSAQPLPSSEAVTALLVNDLLSSPTGDFVLVLDDYHVITAEPIQRAIASLVEHLTPHVRLLLATRVDPALPLARLRARGQLMELRAADLRFTSEEAAAFLRAVMSLDLSSEHVALLERRTEGWIAGLQLAALSLQGRADVPSFLSSFSGSHRFILDYLSQEVLSQQPAALQVFLLRTSILERLSGPLCDAVTGKPGSQAMLEALERANLFLVPLDDERRWYRYHPLFAELLQSRLAQAEPALIPALHRRASAWYEGHDYAMEAVQHALAARDVERAAACIERYAMPIGLRGYVQTVLGWLDALPEALVQARPLLGAVRAAMYMFSSRFEEALVVLQQVEQSLGEELSTEQAQLAMGWACAIRANLAFYAGDLVQSTALAHQALGLFPARALFERGTMQALAAHAYLLSGDVTPSSEHSLAHAVAAARASGNLFAILKSTTLLARLYMLQGRLRQAIATYEQAARVAPQQEIAQVPNGSASYSFGLGEVLCERNELDTAEVLLAQGMDVAGKTATLSADTIVIGYAAMARLQHARGDSAGSLATLDNFARLAHERRFVPAVVAQIGAVRAYIELAQGNLSAALHWARESGLSCEDDELSFPHERGYLTLVRVRLARGRGDPADPTFREVLHLLHRLRTAAESRARQGSVLEILVLSALALQAQGNQNGALMELDHALTLAEPEGYIRLFTDEGAPMRALLRKARAHGLAPDYTDRLLSALDGRGIPPVPAAAPREALVEPLTEREREVLHLLLEGASNREMASRLVVSVNTVKKHIYNICGKLGVRSRTQAVVRARELHLP